MSKLTPMQKRFVMAYAGNATAAAKAAGCSDRTASNSGSRWMRNAQVVAAIRARETKEARPTIADRAERQAFWSDTMRDTAKRDEVRLKASELLGRSVADFTERHEIKGEFTLLDLVRESMEKPKLEAQNASVGESARAETEIAVSEGEPK